MDELDAIREKVNALEREYFRKFGGTPIGSPDGGRFSEDYIKALEKCLNENNPFIELPFDGEEGGNQYERNKAMSMFGLND